MDYNDNESPLTVEEEEKLAVESGVYLNSDPSEEDLQDYLAGNLQSSKPLS